MTDEQVKSNESAVLSSVMQNLLADDEIWKRYLATKQNCIKGFILLKLLIFVPTFKVYQKDIPKIRISSIFQSSR